MKFVKVAVLLSLVTYSSGIEIKPSDQQKNPISLAKINPSLTNQSLTTAKTQVDMMSTGQVVSTKDFS